MKRKRKLGMRRMILFGVLSVSIICCSGCFRKLPIEKSDAVHKESKVAESNVIETDDFEKSKIEINHFEEPIIEVKDLETEALTESILLKAEEEYLDNMTIEEKVAQLFFITPDALTGVSNVVAAGDITEEALKQYPVGGLIYFENNLLSWEQTQEMLCNVQKYSRECMGLPLFLGVDEEGGSVARISGRRFGISAIEDMAIIGANRDYERARETAHLIGNCLCQLGFNIDFAPCADVLTNPYNEVVVRRSFGNDAGVVADMVSIQLSAFHEEGVYGVPKHFPGHGATSGDSHNGYAYIEKSLEELCKEELIPFQRAIDEDVDIIMVGHIACPDITESDTPASLSQYMITDVLRNKMGFDGLVITDALNMSAIQQMYTASQAAVAALCAGADLLLMPADFYSAYHGVLQAIQNGEISEERINESVKRILQLKMCMD